MGKAKSRRQKYHVSAARAKGRNAGQAEKSDQMRSNDAEMTADLRTKVGTYSQ